MNTDPLAELLAGRLRQAQATGMPLPPVRDELAAGGVAQACAVQQANVRHALAAGRRARLGTRGVWQVSAGSAAPSVSFNMEGG